LADISMPYGGYYGKAGLPSATDPTRIFQDKHQ